MIRQVWEIQDEHVPFLEACPVPVASVTKVHQLGLTVLEARRLQSRQVVPRPLETSRGNSSWSLPAPSVCFACTPRVIPPVSQGLLLGVWLSNSLFL